MLEDLEAQAHERVWRRLNPVQDHQLAKLPQLNIKELLCEIEFRCTMLHDIAVKFSDKKEYQGWLQRVQKSTGVALQLEKATDGYFEAMIDIEHDCNSRPMVDDVEPGDESFGDDTFSWNYWCQNNVDGTFAARLADAMSKNKKFHARHQVIPPGGQAIIQSWRNDINHCVSKIRANNDNEVIRSETAPSAGNRTKFIPGAGNSTRVLNTVHMNTIPKVGGLKPAREPFDRTNAMLVGSKPRTPGHQYADFRNRCVFGRRMPTDRNTQYVRGQDAVAQVLETHLTKDGVLKAEGLCRVPDQDDTGGN